VVIGLTGGIGSGKTTVANFFAQWGIAVIDADVIAREVTEPGSKGYDAIVVYFGKDILNASGGLDRKKLRSTVFKNPQAKIWLENTLHPLILNAMRDQIVRVSSPYCVAVIPLLAETSFTVDFLDRICVVDAPEASRKQWAARRDQVSPTDIDLIIAAQSAREKRLAIADDVIINDQDLDFLEAQVKKLHLQYLQMAAA
jgi:dephospho-CoA kinase